METLKFIIDLFDNKFFSIIHGVGALIEITTVFFIIYCFVTGSARILYRLSMGMAISKISIFADKDLSNSLSALLTNSGLFKQKNIEKITVIKSDLGRAENSNIFLVHWPSSKNYMENILKKVNDNVALIVYAPTEEGRIDNDVLKEINYKRNAVIVNFRGRLLNDMVTAMITARLMRK